MRKFRQVAHIFHPTAM